MGNENMHCSVNSCQNVRKSMFTKHDITEVNQQKIKCEMCNNVANNKNTSNTLNSVSMRFKKLQLARGVDVVTQ